MPLEITIRIAPERLNDEDFILKTAASKARIDPTKVNHLRVTKRSIDARKGVWYQLMCELYQKGEQLPTQIAPIVYPDVHASPAVHIIGAGPAGLFAALRLMQLGFRPVIFERGKDVRSRRRDLVKITREQQVDPDSNYCFGEGGAGTYSDGKLYTRSGKRGSIRDVLETLVAHGADPDILVDAHPHIGTNKLPGIITGMRDTIIKHGGEVHFEARVTDIHVTQGSVSELEVNGKAVHVETLVLATGHSARDIFRMFEAKGWAIESKSFALGVRVEHPQDLIDRIQYRRDRGGVLPPASYSLVCQVDQKGVYSFCMCPGGIIAPCATSPGEIVTNGWSPSKRNNPFANSGIVVSVEEADLKAAGFAGPLAAMEFQQMVEQVCCQATGGGQLAPAQRLTDFIKGVKSVDLPACSYKPGVVSVNLRELLPTGIADRLAEGFKNFGQRMKGFITEEAVVVAPESRTSSPVRIPRADDSLEHPDIQGLYPCGEGAGYAGGIVSAAIDGQRIASAIALQRTHSSR